MHFDDASDDEWLDTSDGEFEESNESENGAEDFFDHESTDGRC